MSQVNHQRLREVFLGACDLQGDARQRFLAEHCGDDTDLRAAVDKLLAKDEPDDSVFDASSAKLPERIGGFRILSLLGEGGMGRVYRAEQERPRRTVALKVLRVGMSSAAMQQRFAHEAEVLAKLQHHGIAQVFEFGTDDKLGEPLPFLAMEMVEGRSLMQAARQQRLGLRARVEMFLKVCEAVTHAHQHGVIHRDLKPANILVAQEQPKVLDFGISRMADHERNFHTRTGQLVGTLGYMSPEQIDSNVEPDVRSDVYALGVVLFELLTERLPLPTDELPLAQFAEQLKHRDPPLLGQLDARLRGEIEVIAAKCLEKDRSRRYASAAELAADVRRYLEDQPILARPATALYQLRKFAKRNLAAVVGAGAFVLALCGGMIATWIYAVRAAEQRDDALRENYRAQVAAAAGTVRTDPERALRYLQSAPVDQRGWEWRHYEARIDADYSWTGDSHVIAAPTPDARPLAAVLDQGAILVHDALWGDAHAQVELGGDLRRPRLSPDGTRVAVVDAQTSKLHVVALMQPSSSQQLPLDTVDAQVAWSPDNDCLLTYASSSPARLWCVADGSPIATLPVQPEHATFSPRGDEIWCLLRTHLVICDAATGDELRRQLNSTSHAPPCFSPNGLTFATGNLRACELIDRATGTINKQLTGHREWLIAATFDAASRRIATSGKMPTLGTTRVVDLSDHSLDIAFFGGGHTSLTFDKASGTLIGAGPAGVRILEPAANGQRVLASHTSFLTCVAVHPDGDLIASTGWDRQVMLWDAATGELLATMQVDALAVGVAFSCDGQHVLVQRTGQPGTCVQFDIASGKRVEHEDSRHYFRRAIDGSKSMAPGSHASLGLTNHGGRVLRPHRLGMRVCSAQTGEVLEELTLDDPCTSLALRHDGRQLAVGYRDGRIELWNVSQGVARATRIGELIGAAGQPYCLAFDPSGTRLAAGTDLSVIDLWDVRSRQRVAELAGHDGYVHSVVFSPDGSQLVSGSGDATVRLWDTCTTHSRYQRMRAERNAREQVREWVERLRKQHDNDNAVAAAIRGSDRSADERHSALRLLLRLRRN